MERQILGRKSIIKPAVKNTFRISFQKFHLKASFATIPKKFHLKENAGQISIEHGIISKIGH